MLLLGGEAAQTNLLIFGFSQPKMEYAIFCNRCEMQYNNEMGFLNGRTNIFVMTYLQKMLPWILTTITNSLVLRNVVNINTNRQV
jgi:hypothetical protein